MKILRKHRSLVLSGLRAKRIAEFKMSLPSASSMNPFTDYKLVTSFKDLKKGPNSRVAVVGKIVSTVPHEEIVPITSIMMDVEGDCIAVSVYNCAPSLTFSIGDTVIVADPHVTEVEVVKFVFSLIRFIKDFLAELGSSEPIQCVVPIRACTKSIEDLSQRQPSEIYATGSITFEDLRIIAHKKSKFDNINVHLEVRALSGCASSEIASLVPVKSNRELRTLCFIFELEFCISVGSQVTPQVSYAQALSMTSRSHLIIVPAEILDLKKKPTLLAKIMGINDRDTTRTCRTPRRTSNNRCATLIVDRPNQQSERQLAIHSNRVAKGTTDPHGRLWSKTCDGSDGMERPPQMSVQSVSVCVKCLSMSLHATSFACVCPRQSMSFPLYVPVRPV
ncbi:unnamed protein product [Haemonchus placei]|uniref:TTC5_OB domain-containing protein n=1 Tax=Haemonchus placei TaxID=6290 RepID=A0A158QJL7_HAEPC|nr:unnamed protein product [Haemonchus placei]